jgi:colanic acid biosynthesis glycosyl transferase WcaI
MACAKRILVHDYSGHPFQAELSRSLARRGHDVLHLSFRQFQTPKGDLVAKPDDPVGFASPVCLWPSRFTRTAF